jgi:hypothetical protein
LDRAAGQVNSATGPIVRGLKQVRLVQPENALEADVGEFYWGGERTVSGRGEHYLHMCCTWKNNSGSKPMIGKIGVLLR